MPKHDGRRAGPWHLDTGGPGGRASTMIECHESTFLMTPAQHRQWAANARRRGRPDSWPERSSASRSGRPNTMPIACPL
jgi:hypothetical protein